MTPPDLDRLESYDYHLPPERIAQSPVTPRDASRLMVVDRKAGTVAHHRMTDLPRFLRPADLLVVNDSRVVPARLRGFRTRTGGQWEGLFVGLIDGGDWKLIGQTRGRLLPGESLTIRPATPVIEGEDKSLVLELVERLDQGVWRVRPQSSASPWALLDEFGAMPLPPYIEREAEEPTDRERYQTTYANQPGSIAAPTAGLHFTPELLARCAEQGAGLTRVTLHVGIGTFRPVSHDNLAEHPMHREWCELGAAAADAINRCRRSAGRVIAVGTTSLRTMESAALHGSEGELIPWQGETRLFIRPPYQFRAVDVLLTNFHLPKSTLLMLVCALAGYDLTMHAYETAVREEYRFFSYGDAMLVV